MVMHFLQPPPLYQVHSHRSSRHYHSDMSVAKQAWHGHLPYERNGFPHLTTNNTKYCTHLMSSSNQLSSPVDSSLSHSQSQQLRIVSLSQLSWVHKQANLSQIIQYHLCSCLDNSSSYPSLHLSTACGAWMFHAHTRRLCS